MTADFEIQELNHELREKNNRIIAKARAYRDQAKGSAADDADEVEETVPAPKKREVVVKKPVKQRAASVESEARSDSEPPVAAPKEKVSFPVPGVGQDF